MRSALRRPVIALWIGASVCLPAGSLRAAGPARSEDFRQQLLGFDETLAQIRLAAANDEWKKSDWKSTAISRWLDHLMAEVKRATKRDSLKLPVKWTDVKPGDAAAVNAVNTGTLHVVRDGKFTFLRNSIVLADGSVEAISAENCIIIARSGVRISTSRNNVVLAGYCVDVSHDMMVARANEESSDGSLLMSRSVIRCTYGRGTICSAPDLVDMTQAMNVTFLNSPKRQTSHQDGCKLVTDELIPFHGRGAKNPLADKIKITQVVPREMGGLVIHERNGVEFVVRPGAAVADETGKPLAGLENWRVSFLGRDLVVFSNGHQDAGFFIKR